MWSKPSQAPGSSAPVAEPLPAASIKQRNPGKRYGQIIKLKPEAYAEYKEAHAAVWPEVLKQIKACNITNCTYLPFPTHAPSS